jgi:ABC-type Zn uptake system ZnuABC Zn-binding protein ZnuA
MMYRPWWSLAALGAALALGGCSGSSAASAPAHLRVVATTTLLASLAQTVGAGRADVVSLLPVGASPETYQPSPLDVGKLHDAQVIVENGAGLESWLDGLMRSVQGNGARLVVCSAGLPVVTGNPHLWLDPVYARTYVDRMRDAFVAADPDGGKTYRANAALLDLRLGDLDARIRRAVGSLPPNRRGMIVFHNAWLYYNRRYGLQTLGVIEEFPGTEPSAAHLAQLVDLARAANLRTLFAEPEYNPKLMQAVARSAGITNIAVLYDDSVGTSPATRDYLAMLRTDTRTIVDGLK